MSHKPHITSSDEEPPTTPPQSRITLPPEEHDDMPYEVDATRVEAEILRRQRRHAVALRRLGTELVKEHDEARSFRAETRRSLGDLFESLGRLARDDSRQRESIAGLVGRLATPQNGLRLFMLALFGRLLWLALALLERKLFG